MTSALVALFLFLGAGCSEEGPSRGEKDSSTSVDVSAADLPPPSEGVSPDLATCSSAGISSACDPTAGSGCAQGQCYLTSIIGPACVCPAGAAATGDSCNTTTDCAAGNVCAGTSPPGTCRALCDPGAPQCDAQEKCTPINAFPQYGFCEPS